MKKLLTASLPALALLALGGCSATRSVATTEDDGVYYSSKDRTTAVVRPAPAPQPEAAPASPTTDGATDSDSEATNPDYQATDTRRQARNTPEYYDDSYSSSSYDDDSRFRRPYAGPTVGLAYYSPPVVFAPAVVSYGFPAYGGFGGGFYDPYYSSFASPFYNPYAFYDPFFSPFGYGYGGALVNINLGFGRPWGGYGYGYGRPYYGAYAYDPYYGGYGRGYGSGGYGAYYGSSRRQVIRANGSSYANTNSPVLVGPRRGRGGDVLAGRGNAIAAPGNAPAPMPGRGRRGNVVTSPDAPLGGPTAPGAPASPTVGDASYGRRRRASSDATAPNRPTTITDHDQPTATSRRAEEAERLGRAEATSPTSPSESNVNGRSRRRWRDVNEGGATTGTVPGSEAGRVYERAQPADVQPVEQRPARRARIFESAPDNGQGQATRTYERPTEQPQPRRTYERPAEQPQRTYERPAQPERTYERPSQPSYSSPSPSGGGGNSGGGGGRRGRF